ncbi:mitochondrial ribosomal protein [Plectosphaerella plurivora]|uniref:Mitochondrial ribosomal protein n=1 Tax=Plectosphaerella plurivora TaxID=936078 RepID=A0A9P8V358_9PEZI|nr:mitochondrial ribosomal protein [Plectosphaerella plurivora]
MAPRFPSSLACASRPRLTLAGTASPCRAPTQASAGQTRHATYIHRPRRPYTFTQLIQLSDGSTFTARSTSPIALHRCDKDSRNTLLWQPTEKSLQNVEQDEAGKLAAFRQRFGTGFDLATDTVTRLGSKKGGSASRDRREAEARRAEEEVAAAAAAAEASAFDLGDLISGYAEGVPEIKGGNVANKKDK